MFEEYKDHDIAVYGGYVLDDEELLSCSSGGIATALSKKMIRDGGYVVGVKYTDDFFGAEYLVTQNESDLQLFKGSKYIDADKGTVYEDVKTLLERREKVLFFGLPCVVGAMRSYLGVDYPNLICVELVCHGPTLKEVHKQYINHLENTYGGKITRFSTRYKNGSWTPKYLYAEFENGNKFMEKFKQTEYGYAFSLVSPKRCENCKFKGNDRTADIMLGDFWGAVESDDLYNKNGVSAVLVHTQAGLEFLRSVDEIKLFETTFEKVVRYNQNIIRCANTPDQGEKKKFEALFESKGLIYAAAHSKSKLRDIKLKLTTLIDRVKRKIRKLIK